MATNIFEILKSERNEATHSNMIAWLLNPNESHGGMGVFLLSILRRVDKDHFGDMSNSLPQMSAYTVSREVSFTDEIGSGRMDIVVCSEEDKCVLCIENKTFSKEHSDQLCRYADYIKKNYGERGFRCFFLYLTPGGENPSDSRWEKMSYEELRDILKAKINLLRDGKPKLYIEDYEGTLDNIYCEAKMGKEGFKNVVSGCEENLKKDFPSLTLVSISDANAHFSDSELTQFSPAEENGGYLNRKDLCYVNVKFEQSEREMGVLACSLQFTNHQANLAEGSAFRKTFNPKSLGFRWYTAIPAIEEKLLNEGESTDDFYKSSDANERMYKVLKNLLSQIKEKSRR